MNERVSYWLMPDERATAQLSRIIHNLAARFESPSFEPHVTLYSGPAEPRERLGEVLSAAAGLVPEITLRSTGLAHSDQFTKTLFIEFDADDALTALAEKLKQLSARVEDYDLKPHLSLVYAGMESVRRQVLADSIAVPTTIRFDSLKAILTGTSTCSRGDVESWQVVAERKLG